MKRNFVRATRGANQISSLAIGDGLDRLRNTRDGSGMRSFYKFKLRIATEVTSADDGRKGKRVDGQDDCGEAESLITSNLREITQVNEL